MNTLVIYESKYGATKTYAQWIAEALSCELCERKLASLEQLRTCDTILYGGGLYAGNVSGIDWLRRQYDALPSLNLLLFTCGLTDPADPAQAAAIRKGIEAHFTPEQMQKLQLFHLRGGMDYARLSLPHKAVISMLHQMLKNKAQGEGSSMPDLYGKAVDYTDREAIRPLLAACGKA